MIMSTLNEQVKTDSDLLMLVGQDGILRPIGNRPSWRLHFEAKGRLTIGRRIPSCPTRYTKGKVK